MPGSGKSTVGRLVAKELNYHFIDLDLEIERKEGATIEAVFELKGEAYFRQVEAQVLSDVVEVDGDVLIATGGGAPCFYDGLALMNKVGKTVFINVSPQILIQRLQTDTTRPLLKDGVEKRIVKLYNERLETYRKAQITIEADLLSKFEILKQVIVELGGD